MNKKIIFSDRENPTLETEEKPIIENKESETVIDKTGEQETVKNKPSKTPVWVWALVAIVFIALVVSVLYYIKLKQKENELTKQ